jgi:hypothetical protein
MKSSAYAKGEGGGVTPDAHAGERESWEEERKVRRLDGVGDVRQRVEVRQQQQRQEEEAEDAAEEAAAAAEETEESYVGVHVRRGDKVRQETAETQTVY